MSHYIPAFKAQHEKIEVSFANAHQKWNQKQISDCRIEVENLVSCLKEHHAQECNFFFEKLRANNRLNQGGPFCSYFFEFFMQNRPLIVAEKSIAALRGEKVKLDVPPDVQRFFQENSLLCVPIEEHLAVEALCKELSSALQNFNAKNEAWITDAFFILKDMLTTNHRKEETCLWVACEGILDKSAYSELARTACFTRK